MSSKLESQTTVTENRTLALFDFDGTITKIDSLFDFAKFAFGRRKYYWGLFQLSPMLIAYAIGLIPNHRAKEKFITYFVDGMSVSDFQRVADRYSLERIDEIVRPKAIERIRWHRENGHEVVIVSAAIESWLSAWCKKEGINLLATGLEVKGRSLTGKLSTNNCNGAEKVRRIKSEYCLSGFACIYSYGDSGGDKEMLEIADKKFYKPFLNQ